MEKVKRNELVALALDMSLTQQDVADIFGITRERARQIYNKVRGKPVGRRKQRGEVLNPLFVYCSQCGKKWPKESIKRFCNKECRLQFYYYSDQKRVCHFCKRTYYATRNRKYYEKKFMKGGKNGK